MCCGIDEGIPATSCGVSFNEVEPLRGASVGCGKTTVSAMVVVDIKSKRLDRKKKAHRFLDKEHANRRGGVRQDGFRKEAHAG